jgi:AraC-like DNA-binding protein
MYAGGNVLDMVQEYMFFPGEGRICDDYQILPHGCFDIVFAISETLNKVMIHGPRTRVQNISGHDYDIAIIRFKAGGLPKILDGKPLDFVDQTVELTTIFSHDAQDLCEMIWEKQTFPEKIAVMERLLAGSHDLHPLKENRLFSLARDAIISRNASIKVHEVAAMLDVSTRTLERLFLKFLGISPKQFIRLIRFQEIINSIKISHSPTMHADLAYAAGFTDQSHFIKEFKELSGMTPRVFLKNPPCRRRKMACFPSSCRYDPVPV